MNRGTLNFLLQNLLNRSLSAPIGHSAHQTRAAKNQLKMRNGHHIPQARKAGLRDIQIREAVQLADRVRRVPARKVVQAAWAKLEESSDDPSDRTGTGCGCPEAAVTP